MIHEICILLACLVIAGGFCAVNIVVVKQAYFSWRRGRLLNRHGFNGEIELADAKLRFSLGGMSALGALIMIIFLIFFCDLSWLQNTGGILIAVGLTFGLITLIVSPVTKSEMESAPIYHFTGHVLWHASDGCHFVNQASPDEIAELVKSKGFVLYVKSSTSSATKKLV